MGEVGKNGEHNCASQISRSLVQILRHGSKRHNQLVAPGPRATATSEARESIRPISLYYTVYIGYQFSDYCCPARRKYVRFSTQLFAPPIELLTMPTSLERKYLDQYPKLENISNYKVVANVSIYLTVYLIFYFKVLLTMLFSKRQ